MRLSHLGASYEFAPRPVRTIETGLKARFLGQSYAVHALTDMSAQPQVNLVYRGVSYKAR